MFEKLFRRSRASFRKKSRSEMNASYIKGTKSLDRGFTAHNVAFEDSKSIVDPLSNPSLEFVENNQKMSTEDNSSESLNDTIKHSPESMFEDSVLEAIQIGNLSIAEFLKSPYTSPNIVIKANTPNSSGCVENKVVTNKVCSSTSFKSSKSRNLSLLDKAHSQDGGKSYPQKNSIKVQPIEDTLSKETIPDLLKKDSELVALSTKNELEKSRFSKSLETLAQEVFGAEYQVYLDFASKSPTKIPLITSSKNQYKVKKERNTSLPLRNDTENIVVNKMLISRTLTSQEDRVPKLHKEKKTCLSLDLQANEIMKTEPLRSWNNAPDLRSLNNLCGGSSCMPSICEGADLALGNSAESDDSEAQSEYKNRGFFLPSESHYLCYNRESIDDSLSENLNGSIFSVTDIEFPPPPPLDDIDDNEPTSIKRRLVETIKYRSGVSSYVSKKSDPLIESLISIVPLPEDHTELVPALTTALSEIVSEIISSRQKLQRMFKAIEFHQQIFKEQNRKISSQALEILQLRKALSDISNISSTLTPRNSGAALTPRNSISHSNRRSENVRLNRQSNEVVELSDTLDKLIFQCAELQRTPRNNSDGNVQGCSSIQTNTYPTKKLKNTHVAQTSVALE